MKCKWYHILLSLVAASGCQQLYDAPVKPMATGYLVVEGFISDGTTTIQLSRTTMLSDTSTSVYEDGAQITVESNGSDSFALSGSGNGVYSNAIVVLNKSEQYRLRIQTAAGEIYVSDFESLKATPQIDSVSWAREDGGVQIFATTHDPLDTSRYFYWTFSATWEFHSDYVSSLSFIMNNVTGQLYGVRYKYPDGHEDSSVYRCWSNLPSSSILINSTENVSPDVVYQQPLMFIPQGSQQLSVLFSILVNQYSISKGAYQFFQQLKNNTEQLGTIFDPLPSGLQGNIHCLTNTAETVVGFVDVSNLQQQRIFIANSQVPDWDYIYVGCVLDTLSNDSTDLSKVTFENVLPIAFVGNSMGQFTESSSDCIDCTLTGSNVKPTFWP
ncbi:MAG TPA: DUF4249 domain-containing protein [Puia sp.]|nr:DUF4249 domain-containing protein [Puia sp.]